MILKSFEICRHRRGFRRCKNRRRSDRFCRVPVGWKINSAEYFGRCLLRSRCLRIHNSDNGAGSHQIQGEIVKEFLWKISRKCRDSHWISSVCLIGITRGYRFQGAKIQLLDLPGIIEGAKDGKGRGRQVIAVARTCSLIFIVLDVLKPLGHKKIIERELEGFGIRLNKDQPQITLRRKDKGEVR